MSREYAPCEVTLEFGDGEHLFKLPLKMIGELQDKCDAPIGTIFKRVLTGDYRGADLIETVRCGLVGGGMAGPEARKMIDRYCDRWPLEVWYAHTLAILSACIVGYEGADKSKKAEGESPTSSSPSETPTETVPSLA